MSRKQRTNDAGLGELTTAVANLVKLVEMQNDRIDGLQKQSAPAEIAGLKRTVGQLAESVEQMKGVTRAAIEERERERQYFVRELAGNHRVPFLADELEAMPIDLLRKLGAMVQLDTPRWSRWVGSGDGLHWTPGTELVRAHRRKQSRKRKARRT